MDNEEHEVEDHEEQFEYVEVLDADHSVYDHDEVEMIGQSGAHPDPESEEIMHVTIDEDLMKNYEEIQYVETEVEVGDGNIGIVNDENQTIFIHEGRKYIIPNEQLINGDQTIILDEEDGQLIEEEQADYYADAEDAEDIEDTVLTNIEPDFQDTPTQYEENDELSEITGKNLITGQTISLTGILEKMRRKTNINDIKQTRNHAKQPQEPLDYVLVPPVTRRVEVGRTPDGKRLVGHILQIQKKIQPHEPVKINETGQNTNIFTIAMPPNPKQTKRQRPRSRKKEQPIKKSSPCPPSMMDPAQQLRYVTRTALEENVARTLAGLMDLESINKKLKGRRLIVRHLQRRSRDGKIITTSKKIAYYCGRLRRETAADNWTFVQEYPSKTSDGDGGIDLPQNPATEQVNVHPGQTHSDSDNSECEEEYTLTVYLTETQDEHGKKKTKVTIPEFTNPNTKLIPPKSQIHEDFVCKSCGKKFQSVASLKRHSTVHDHSLRPLQCMTCLGRFTDESSLKKHMMLHTGLRPHKCNLCEKSFAHRGDLNFHIRTHDSQKRYECSVCKKQFNRHSNMLRHSEIHRPNSKDTTPDLVPMKIKEDPINNEEIKTPFTCDKCGISYNFSSSLTRHIVNVHLKQTDDITN